MINLYCNDVFISKRKNKYRTISTKCKDNLNAKFSIEGKLSSNRNIFQGYVENLNMETLTGKSLTHKSKNQKNNFLNILNGTYNFITNENFEFKKIEFKSINSTIKIKTINQKFWQNYIKINGKVQWDKNNQEVNFLNLSFNDLVIDNGKLNFKKREGIVNVNLDKLSLEKFKFFVDQHYYQLNSILNIYPIVQKNLLKIYLNQLKGGSLNNVNISINFTFNNDFEKFHIIKIIGNSEFSNIRFHNTNKYFKSILSTVSGRLNFGLRSNNSEKSKINKWLQLVLKASNGIILTKNSLYEYKFDTSDIKLKITNNSFNIYNADFYKNSNLDYSFKDIKIEEGSLIKGYLKLRSNNQLLYKLQKETNIKLLGSSDLFFKIYGDIKNLDFQLDLNSDLSHSLLNIPLINVIKKKDIESSIKSKIIIKKGKIKFLENTILKIKNETLRADLITFNYSKSNNIIFKNIITPFMDLKEIKISNISNHFVIEAFGKLLNLTDFRKKIEDNEIDDTQKLNFDITADKIILDPSISFSGNLKGIKTGDNVQAIGLGTMWLGNSQILESGKLQISINNNSSNIHSFGLTGGAETKIILNKNINQFPTISFDTINGGKLLSALNFTNKVRSGKMKINLQFLDNSYDHYEGVIKAKNFSLIHTPAIINSLSILSFSGIESILIGEGVSFDNGEVKIYVKDNVFNFDPLLLSSESLGIKARGKLNLYNHEIDLRGSVAPIKMISQIISSVPAVGEIITGLKKDGLFAGQFKMIGPFKDPKVTLNAFSFAPGILREFFSNNWLDKDNFFVKNKSN